MNETQTQKNTLKDLGDGLVLRRSTAQDAEALSEFNARLHSDFGPEQPDMGVSAWTKDLLTRPHPTFDAADFTIVEDTNTGKIVSSLNLISQTWTYEGVPFGVGRPELVGTLPEYRNRGLVRVQFDEVHRWSAERGELVQGITGIPYYYRIFGYEMALNLGGGRAGFTPQIPALKDGESEPYLLRDAELKDIPFLNEMYLQATRRSLVNCVWDEALWKYELEGKSPENVNRRVFKLIESVDGEGLGVLAHPPTPWGAMLAAVFYEIRPEIPWSAVTPSAIRHLVATGKAYIEGQQGKSIDAFGFWLGSEHPVYEVLKDRLPRVRPPYAWYLRVPNLPGFLKHIQGVLEERLARSPMQGYTGELKITFYRSGVMLKFEKGRLVETADYQPTPFGHSGDAAFPGLTFLQTLFGYNTLDDLRTVFPDAFASNDEAYALISALFPKRYSEVWPVS